MTVCEHVPGRDELDLLDEIYALIRTDDALCEIVRGHLRAMSREPPPKPHELARLLDKPSSRQDFVLVATAYDFATEQLAATLLNLRSLKESLRRALLDKTDLLQQKRTARLLRWGGVVPELGQLFGLGKDALDIPTHFGGDYFGYRRSANKQEIIRFHLKIEVADDRRKAYFTGEYRRGVTHWNLRGIGWYVGGSLYLCGHARTEDDREASLGLRFLALRQFQQTECLNGLVLSTNDAGLPISARIFLVPIQSHKLPRDLLHKHSSDYPNFIDEMITKPASYSDEVAKHLANIFNDEGSGRLLDAIRNGTYSVLISYNLESLPGHGRESLAEKEERLREFHQRNELSNADILDQRYREFIDAVVAEMDLAPPH